MVAAHAAKYFPLVIDVVVDAVGKVVIVPCVDVAKLIVVHAGDVVTRVVGGPEILHEGRTERIETVGRNRVVREGRARYRTIRAQYGGERIVNGPENWTAVLQTVRLREVPLLLQRSRQRGDVAVRGILLPVLDRKEVEELVLY